MPMQTSQTSRTTEDETRASAETYFDAWRARDFDRLRSVLTDDATFSGPLGTVEGGDACRDGIEQLSQIVTDVVVQERFVDGPDALTWFELRTTVADPIAVVNWSHVEHGHITRVRALFDPRPLLAGA